jgi:hypothetical protein
MSTAQKWSRRWVIPCVGVALVAGSGCRGTGRLAEYDFRDRTLAIAWVDAPEPRVLTSPIFLEHPDNPVHLLLSAGTSIAKEVEATKARARLDSAVAIVDVQGRMCERTLERAARYLRARPIGSEDRADFILEVRLRRWGIDAKDWSAAAHFFVDAEVHLLDGETGREVWHTRAHSRDAIAPSIFGPGHVVRNVVTAAALANQSVEEIARAMERLADYSSDHVTEHLRDALNRVRG